MTHPPDTHGCSHRESRPVPFFEEGCLWNLVGQGVIASRDVDARFQLSPPPQSPQTPPPLLPYQLQNLPPARAPPRSAPALPPALPPVRRPLGVVDPNIQTLTVELRKLETENTKLRQHIRLQDNVISGFCALQVYERENK